MVTSTYYAIVFERSARDSSNHWEFYEGPAKSNSVALKRSSSTWSTIAGIDDFAFKIYTLQSTTGWDFKLQASSDSGDIRAILDYVALRR
jgi:hypothetical protein